MIDQKHHHGPIKHHFDKSLTTTALNTPAVIDNLRNYATRYIRAEYLVLKCFTCAPRSRSYLFGGIMWHNGNSKWEAICVSRYKQCHFRAGHQFVFKPDANNNRTLREWGDTSARFIATKLPAQSTCRPTSPSFRAARTCVHVCSQCYGDNVNETLTYSRFDYR